jgi:hypothetical protein
MNENAHIFLIKNGIFGVCMVDNVLRICRVALGAVAISAGAQK